MVYRIDNRKKKQHGRYTALGIVFGVILALGGVYVYENYKKLILENVNDIITENTPKSEPKQTIQVPQIQPIRQLSADEIAQQIHVLVNQERARNGLGSLAWEPDLAKIALSHSNDMMKNNYFDHNDLQGHNPSYRLDCYNPRENIAWTDGYNLDIVPAKMVSDWMGSQTHRDNILNNIDYGEGIGVAISGSYVIVTEDFC